MKVANRKRVLVTGNTGFWGSPVCERPLDEGVHDVTFPICLEVDAIFNLACPASPVQCQRDPVEATKKSVHGCINMLGLDKRTGARIINTHVSRMHPNDGRVVRNSVVQALQGKDITIYGDGLQTRSFNYVDDLIEGFVRLMASPAGLTGPINLGNPSKFTIRELAESVLDLVGGTSKLFYRPPPHDDPKQRQPDISLAKSELDWAPRIPLKKDCRRPSLFSGNSEP